MAEARVVRHRAEDIQIAGLGLQVDGQLVPKRPVVIAFGPRAVEAAEQRLRPGLIQEGTELAEPVRKEIAAPLHPLRLVLSHQKP